METRDAQCGTRLTGWAGVLQVEPTSLSRPGSDRWPRHIVLPTGVAGPTGVSSAQSHHLALSGSPVAPIQARGSHTLPMTHRRLFPPARSSGCLPKSFPAPSTLTAAPALGRACPFRQRRHLGDLRRHPTLARVLGAPGPGCPLEKGHITREAETEQEDGKAYFPTDLHAGGTQCGSSL